MNELTKTNQNLTKKEAIGQYVHDMLDLEIRVFSLRKMAEEARMKLEQEDSWLKYELQKAKNDKDSACQDYNSANAEKEKQTFGTALFDALMGSVIGVIFGIIIPLLYLLGGIIATCVGAGIEGLGLLGISIVVFIISVIIAIPFAIAKLADNSELQKLEETAKCAEDHLMEVQKRYDEFHRMDADKLRKSITAFENSVSKIEAALQKNYALNIIPPDYRRLECLAWIDYVFRNDQVDTMREATLQCDKWVRHGETLQALHDLAENIRSIADLLHNMDDNISMMNQDLYRIAEAQGKQLVESRGIRYAMESVKKGTEKLTHYEEMRRWGSF